MLSPELKERLRDPAYFDLHLQATAIWREIGAIPWYDSVFLRRFEAARLFLKQVKPDALPGFVEGFAPLRPPAHFEPQLITDLFDEATFLQVRDLVAELPPEQLEKHEVETFGRDVVHDHPFLTQLQEALTEKISNFAEIPLEPGYNFLSLYGPNGRCGVHMDQPISMYTLDFCIDQSVEWPIYMSKLVDWPTSETTRNWDAQAIKDDPSMEFAPFTLRPNNALLFCGSSQWHYRDPVPAAGYCNLLFLHFFPAGQKHLVRYHQWPEHFQIAELEPLCDLFGQLDQKQW